MLYDKNFLLELDQQQNRIISARITALTFNEQPIETIEGSVTGGSINIDGASALRRTCSLTMTVEKFNYSNYYWSLHSKFKLEIGLQNFINPNIPDIIWFNQGIYIITGFNTAQTTNNFTLSINGKDKMCLLNGEVGGSLESSVDFGTIEEENAEGVWQMRKIPIPEIIRNAVHVYGGEPYEKIIINDLETQGLELLGNDREEPIYLYWYNNENLIPQRFAGVILDGNTQAWDEKNKKALFLKDMDETSFIELSGPVKSSPSFLLQFLEPPNTDNYTVEEKDGKIYYQADCYLAKIPHSTIGYRITELVYAGDLIANIGETLTSILDKIKNMLVEFEYFYDVDGNFVFQKKKSFTGNLWMPISNNDLDKEQMLKNLLFSEPIAYIFENNKLITAMNNTPNILNMRNDYSIWGERISTSGAAIPIHLRFAIDTKPKSYKSINIDENDTVAKGQIAVYNEKYKAKVPTVQESIEYSTSTGQDWREIIYQMALDYYQYNFLSDFPQRVAKANPENYPTGYTGYEQYYIDLQGFWRDLYQPLTSISKDELNIDIDNLGNAIEQYEQETLTDSEVAKEAASLQEKYKNYLPAISNIVKPSGGAPAAAKIGYAENIQSFLKSAAAKNPTGVSLGGWNMDIINAPELLNFWFDFLDAEDELAQFNVKRVGSRPKVINDNMIKAIKFGETPEIIFTTEKPPEDSEETGYKYVWISNEINEQLSVSSQGKSAKDKLDELIYQHGYCTESVSITAVPVYYLEPNSRILLKDKNSQLNGEYIVSKITLPLTYNGTMSITATKAVEPTW